MAKFTCQCSKNQLAKSVKFNYCTSTTNLENCAEYIWKLGLLKKYRFPTRKGDTCTGMGLYTWLKREQLTSSHCIVCRQNQRSSCLRKWSPSADILDTSCCGEALSVRAESSNSALRAASLQSPFL